MQPPVGCSPSGNREDQHDHDRHDDGGAPSALGRPAVGGARVDRTCLVRRRRPCREVGSLGRLLHDRLTGKAALEIINEDLLAGMKVVGELFGSGQMQLPFVLQSAEVMKTAVSHLEPHIDKVEGSSGKGTLVLATVRGDVHDIGKNLVDIIVSNNGYTVINIGIKQPIQAIIDAAETSGADALGTMVATSPITGSGTSLVLEPSLTADGGLLLSATRATVRGVEFDLNDESASAQILKILGMEIPDITIGPEILPTGMTLNTVAVAEKGLALTMSGENLSMEQF